MLMAMSCALAMLPSVDLPAGGLDAHEASILDAKLQGRGVRDIATQHNVELGEVIAVLSRPHVVREHAARMVEQRTDTVVMIETGLRFAVAKINQFVSDPLADVDTVLRCSKALCELKKLGLEQERMGLEFALKRDEMLRKAARRHVEPVIHESSEQVLVWDTQSRALISGATPVTVAVLNSPSINKPSEQAADTSPIQAARAAVEARRKAMDTP